MRSLPIAMAQNNQQCKNNHNARTIEMQIKAMEIAMKLKHSYDNESTITKQRSAKNCIIKATIAMSWSIGAIITSAIVIR